MKNLFNAFAPDKLDYETFDEIIDDLIEGVTVKDPVLKTALSVQGKALLLYIMEFHKKQFSAYNFFRIASMSVEEIDGLFKRDGVGNQTSRSMQLNSFARSFPAEIRESALYILAGQTISKYLPLFARDINNPIDFKIEKGVPSAPLNTKQNKPEPKKKAQKVEAPAEDDVFEPIVPANTQESQKQEESVDAESVNEPAENENMSDEELFFRDGLSSTGSTFGGGW